MPPKPIKSPPPLRLGLLDLGAGYYYGIITDNTPDKPIPAGPGAFFDPINKAMGIGNFIPKLPLSGSSANYIKFCIKTGFKLQLQYDPQQAPQDKTSLLEFYKNLFSTATNADQPSVFSLTNTDDPEWSVADIIIDTQRQFILIPSNNEPGLCVSAPKDHPDNISFFKIGILSSTSRLTATTTGNNRGCYWDFSKRYLLVSDASGGCEPENEKRFYHFDNQGKIVSIFDEQSINPQTQHARTIAPARVEEAPFFFPSVPTYNKLDLQTWLIANQRKTGERVYVEATNTAGTHMKKAQFDNDKLTYSIYLENGQPVAFLIPSLPDSPNSPRFALKITAAEPRVAACATPEDSQSIKYFFVNYNESAFREKASPQCSIAPNQFFQAILKRGLTVLLKTCLESLPAQYHASIIDSLLQLPHEGEDLATVLLSTTPIFNTTPMDSSLVALIPVQDNFDSLLALLERLSAYSAFFADNKETLTLFRNCLPDEHSGTRAYLGRYQSTISTLRQRLPKFISDKITHNPKHPSQLGIEHQELFAVCLPYIFSYMAKLYAIAQKDISPSTLLVFYTKALITEFQSYAAGLPELKAIMSYLQNTARENTARFKAIQEKEEAARNRIADEQTETIATIKLQDFLHASEHLFQQYAQGLQDLYGNALIHFAEEVARNRIADKQTETITAIRSQDFLHTAEHLFQQHAQGLQGLYSNALMQAKLHFAKERWAEYKQLLAHTKNAQHLVLSEHAALWSASYQTLLIQSFDAFEEQLTSIYKQLTIDALAKRDALFKASAETIQRTISAWHELHQAVLTCRAYPSPIALPPIVQEAFNFITPHLTQNVKIYLVGSMVRKLLCKEDISQCDIDMVVMIPEGATVNLPPFFSKSRHVPNLYQAALFDTSGTRILIDYVVITTSANLQTHEHLTTNVTERDLTINGFYCCRNGWVYCPDARAHNDLQQKLLRTITPADYSFTFDCVRTLRTIKLMMDGFRLTPPIEHAMMNFRVDLNTVDDGHIFAVLKKHLYLLTKTNQHIDYLVLLHRFNILQKLFPHHQDNYPALQDATDKTLWSTQVMQFIHCSSNSSTRRPYASSMMFFPSAPAASSEEQHAKGASFANQ